MSEGLSGNLAQLPFRDLLRMLCGADQTGRIEFQSGPERAEVFLRNGHVVHATAESSAGETAFAVILGWTKGMFRFDAGVSTIETTISKSLRTPSAGTTGTSACRGRRVSMRSSRTCTCGAEG